MRAGQLPIDEQVAHLRAALSRNRTLTEVLARAATMDLPGWYLVAGCLYQTVWNIVTGQPAEAGILDYDLASRHVYEAKTTRWRRQWPGLTSCPGRNNPQPPAHPALRRHAEDRT
jgi:hypothetical protein